VTGIADSLSVPENLWGLSKLLAKSTRQTGCVQGFRSPGKGDGNSALSFCPKVKLAYIRVQSAARGTRSPRRTSHIGPSVDSLACQTTCLEKHFSQRRELRRRMSKKSWPWPSLSRP